MRITYLLACVVLISLVDNAFSRGFRIRTGGFRSFRSSSSYRSSSGSYRSSSTSYRGSSGSYRGSRSRYVPRVPKYSGYNKAIAAGAVVHGMSRYRIRFSGSNNFRSDPQVCYTSKSGYNDTGSAISTLGYFVCPRFDSDSPSDTYCCGPADKQNCCGYWDNGGRVAGAVIGIIFAVIFLLIMTCCIVGKCCCKKEEKPDNSVVVMSDINKTQDNAEVQPMALVDRAQPYPDSYAAPTYPLYPNGQYAGNPHHQPSYPQAYPSEKQAMQSGPYPNAPAPPYQPDNPSVPQYPPYPSEQYAPN